MGGTAASDVGRIGGPVGDRAPAGAAGLTMVSTRARYRSTRRNVLHVRRAAAVGLAILVVGLIDAAQAEAGTYVIRNCNVPGYATAPIIPWKASLVPNVAMFNTCSSGGGFGLMLPGPRTVAAYAQPHFDVVEPASIELRRIRIWMITRLAGSGSPLIGVRFILKNPITASGNEVYPPGGDTLARPIDERIDDDAIGFRISLACRGFGGNEPPAPDCNADDVAPLEVRGTEMTLEENVNPVGVVNGGTLFAEGSVSGIRSLDYSVSDGQSGLKSIQVSVGPAVLATKDLSGSCTYAEFAACSKVDSGTLAIDTSQVSDGIQPVTFRVTDAAGNDNTFQVQLINVHNGRAAAAGPAASGVNGNKELTARLVGSKRATVIVPFGTRVTVKGRLSAASKSGIGSARIEVLQRSGAKERRVGSAKTRKDGTFTYRRTVRGPTRTMRFVYREQSGVVVASPNLRLRVRASASLRVRLKARRLRFSGRVLSRPLPQKGKEVRLQGRTPGFTWATFAKKRTDRRGRFSGSYRLPVRRPGVRLQIRAWIPGERGYRYLSYKGQPREIRVR